ncbi:FUSC family protein [Rhizobium sp. RU35A]|uniref:FUSC family protein n=1 Tax=Rhizobium sp. RU35A TaxID=1907414 RepID=UPI00122CC319|nr:FUSC family protein [Rhizobium sp. RU35A]
MTRRLRWLGRRLELRSFGLIPEHFNRVEGYRAALAVAMPLGLALATGHAEWGWAVFAAYWTCLCDAPGPDTLRSRLLGVFVAGGTLVAFLGSWLASFFPHADMVIGPLLVFLAVVAAALLPYGGLVGTLLAVVAVVAVGFPHPLPQALGQSFAFLGGATWAYLLINVVWRIDPLAPLRRATEAVTVRLLDMADNLVALGDGAHRDADWHSDHAEHRRAVRLAIERLRSLLARYEGENGASPSVHQALAAAETTFGTLIALDQAYIDRVGLLGERLATAQACRKALLAWHVTLRAGTEERAIARARARVRALRHHLTEPVFVGCALALERALHRLAEPLTASAPDSLPPAGQKGRGDRLPTPMIRQAARQAAGLLAVYAVATLFQLGYPYWAAMAVIVVLQGGLRITWARALERIAGSLLGGLIALMVLQVISAQLPLSLLAVALAAASISLRSVNYTIFVVFLTMLFVFVTDMLHPGAGIASARMLDNVIGSVAALLAVFLFWPDFGTALSLLIREGIEANGRYRDAVLTAEPADSIERARREAGVASVEAEVAFHDLGGLLQRLGNRGADVHTLQDMRNLAGRAAMDWHRLLANQAPGEGERDVEDDRPVRH